MAKIRGAYIMKMEVLLDGTTGTGAVPAAVKERSNVVNKEAQGKKTANQGTAELNNGMDHHGTQLLSIVVSCG